MTIQDWFAITLTALSIIAILGVAVRWIVRHYVKDIVAELKPNGGSSIKDQVNRLENQVNEIKKSSKETDIKTQEISTKLDHLYEIFIEYLAGNQKQNKDSKSKKS